MAHLDFIKHQAEMIYFQDRMLKALRVEKILLHQKLSWMTKRLKNVGEGAARNEGRKLQNCSLPTAQLCSAKSQLDQGEGGERSMPLPLVERREVAFELKDEFCPELPKAKYRKVRGLQEERKVRRIQEEMWAEDGGLAVRITLEEEKDKEVGEEPPNILTSKIFPTGLENGNGKAVVKVKNLEIGQEIAMIDLKAIGEEDMANLHKGLEVPSWREDVKHYALLAANEYRSEERV